MNKKEVLSAVTKSRKVKLDYPFEASSVRALRAGDIVRLSGCVYTGRDRLHKFLAEGGTAPVSLQDGAIYHCGPIMRPLTKGWRAVAAGPTTSIREEPYMAHLIEHLGVRVIIGKGGMGSATLKACQEFGCVYLQTAGGAAAFLAKRIKKVVAVFFLEEFGPTEALWQLELAGLEAVVGMDAHGVSLYDKVSADSAQILTSLRS